MRASLIAVALALTSLAANGQTPASQPAPSTKPVAAKTIASEYPRLGGSGLLNARVAELPKDVVLSAGEVVLKESDLADQIGKAPQEVREQLRKSAFSILDQMATRQLLLGEAKASAVKAGKDAAKLSEKELFQGLMESLMADIKVTEQEVKDFYAANKDMIGDATLADVKPAIEKQVLQDKQQARLRDYVGGLGERTKIEVAAGWAKSQEALARDNVVDKARDSGKPSLVDFGSKGCIPCDKLAPILETLKTKYEGKANVLFVSVREEQVLASRYGIQSIPVQIFFDKDGKEVFRHTGFWSQEELEKKLAGIGVK